MPNPRLIVGFFMMLMVVASAQESRPTAKPSSKPAKKLDEEVLEQDPTALKAYKAATSSLYRPREHGLKALKFHFEVKVELPDGRKMNYGPFKVAWDMKTGHQVALVGKWQPGMIKVEQISANFIDEVVNDVVGWQPGLLTKGRHISLDQDKRIVIRLPKKEQAKTPIRRILIAPNKMGQIRTQSLVGEKDYPLMVREYDYIARHKRVLVEHVRITAGQTKKVKSHTYVDHGGFTFPEKITAFGVEQGTRTVNYSAYEIPKKATK